MLGWSCPHSISHQSLKVPCTLFGCNSNSSQILPSIISSIQLVSVTESPPSAFYYFGHCTHNRCKRLILQVLGQLLGRLSCRHITGSSKDSVLSSPTPYLLCGSFTRKSSALNSAGKSSMSIVHVLAGQSLKPGLFFTAFRLGNFSRQWLRRGADCISLRCETTGALWNESWREALHGKPVPWLLARHSAWLLFGLCTYSIAAGTGSFLGSPALAEPIVDRHDADGAGLCDIGPTVTASATSHGKKLLTNYSVIGIPGDGRCLFRAVAHGAHVRKGLGAPSESLQRESADALRGKVVDELVKRREETEWFIEGDFDSYTKRMRQPYVWGGEPELLMASHVLRMPITVYMFEQRARGLISIAEYGQEYAKENSVPIRVLYHGFGHYDALQLPDHHET
ncbi:hypothetical protein L7F22_051808 [Adiantum nelumboides]|nr:hypothetical protein [Adiantum nelumboides]